MKEPVDYKSFEADLYKATKALIESLLKKYGAQNIRAFCLYSDEDAGSSVFTFDTYENYQKQISTVDESEYDYYKWYFGEWLEDKTLAADLNQLSKTLFGAEYGETTEDFVNHKNKIYSGFVSVLKKLKMKEMFKSLNKDFILMFGISDFEDREKELDWMQQLNEQDVFEDFKKYRESY